MSGLARRLIAVVCLLATLSAAAWAQGYPNRRITLVVPFPAGSGTDVVARLVAKELSPRESGSRSRLKISPARAGLPERPRIARAEPDGYTLMLNSSGHPSSR